MRRHGASLKEEGIPQKSDFRAMLRKYWKPAAIVAVAAVVLVIGVNAWRDHADDSDGGSSRRSGNTSMSDRDSDWDYDYDDYNAYDQREYNASGQGESYVTCPACYGTGGTYQE